MGFPKSSPTNEGKKLLLRALAGEQLQFSAIKIGDGKVTASTDISALTGLINELHSFNIASIRKETDSVTLYAPFDNREVTETYQFREIGVFALDPMTNREVLYSYTNCGEEAEKIEGVNLNFVEKTLKIIVTVNDAENVKITVNPNLNYITRAEFDEVVDEKINENKVTKTSQLKNDSNFVTRWDLPDGVDVVDNLESTLSYAALSANQGRVLNESKVDKVDGKGLSTNDFNDEYLEKLNNFSIFLSGINSSLYEIQKKLDEFEQRISQNSLDITSIKAILSNNNLS